MKCNKCDTEMLRAYLTGNGLYPVLLTNKKKGVFETERRSAVLSYVCPQCGHIELYAENPQKLKLD